MLGIVLILYLNLLIKASQQPDELPIFPVIVYTNLLRLTKASILRCTREPKVSQSLSSRAQMWIPPVSTACVHGQNQWFPHLSDKSTHTWGLTKRTDFQVFVPGFWFSSSGLRPKIWIFNKHWTNIRQVNKTHTL